MDHVQFACDEAVKNWEGHYPCMFCDGGLFACALCSSFEGATTTDCPGTRMTMTHLDLIYAGTLDFRDGKWVNAASQYWKVPHG